MFVTSCVLLKLQSFGMPRWLEFFIVVVIKKSWYSDSSMMYDFMTLNDGTGIAHSDVVQKDGKEMVKVYFEQPIDGGFNAAECWLPTYEWSMRKGFSDEQMRYFQKLLENSAHVIIPLARDGGFEHAAGF